MKHQSIRAVWILLTLFVIMNKVSSVKSCKILFLAAFPGKSHWIMMDKLINGLLDRGHEVTTITNFKLDRDQNLMKNYTEILIDPPFEKDKVQSIDDILKRSDMSVFAMHIFFYKFFSVISRHGLQTENVKQFIKQQNLKFDLIIFEEVFQDSWLMFSHIYKAPIVTVSAFGYADFMDNNMGLVVPWSFVPHAFLEYTDDMNFFEKCFNVVVELFDHIVRKVYYLPLQNQIARESFSYLEIENNKLPTVEELMNSKSLVLANNHVSFAAPRPKLPGMIDIGGLNLGKQVKKLPEDIQKFLDESKHGVIYFSWGSNIKSSSLPKEKLKIFINVFKNLKERILWKWDSEITNELPSNVMVKKWMPQTSILSHPNVKLFISHGGIFSIQESLYHGVPLLIIPFYGDQKRNAIIGDKKGYALYLNYRKITEVSLSDGLTRILTAQSFRETANEISNIFRDNINEPLDEAMFWIEYVIRHNGAKHWQSKARKLNFAQYLLWDVFAFFFLILMIATALFYKLFTKMLGKNLKPKSNNKKGKKNKNL